MEKQKSVKFQLIEQIKYNRQIKQQQAQQAQQTSQINSNNTSNNTSNITTNSIIVNQQSSNEARAILNSIQQSTQKDKFVRFVNLHSMVKKVMIEKNGKHSELSPELLSKCQFNFDRLKFADYEDGVHYKVLGRNMFRLHVFSTLDSAIQFCETLIPGQKMITFEDLLKLSRSNNISTQDVIRFYLHELSNETDLLPKQQGSSSSSSYSSSSSSTTSLSSPSSTSSSSNSNSGYLPKFERIPSEGLHLFHRKIIGNESHLTLIPRQKQTIVKKHSGLVESTEHSLHKNVPIVQPLSKNATANSVQDVSIRIKRGLQRADSGYSYRQNEGGKVKNAGPVAVVSHNSKDVSFF